MAVPVYFCKAFLLHVLVGMSQSQNICSPITAALRLTNSKAHPFKGRQCSGWWGCFEAVGAQAVEGTHAVCPGCCISAVTEEDFTRLWSPGTVGLVLCCWCTLLMGCSGNKREECPEQQRPELQECWDSALGDCWGVCRARGWTLMILEGPLQLRIFHGSMKYYSKKKGFFIFIKVWLFL